MKKIESAPVPLGPDEAHEEANMLTAAIEVGKAADYDQALALVEELKDLADNESEFEKRKKMVLRTGNKAVIEILFRVGLFGSALSPEASADGFAQQTIKEHEQRLSTLKERFSTAEEKLKELREQGQKVAER
jgi:hypothetical protein